MLACPRCPNRSFNDFIALRQHTEAGKHGHSIPCPHCNEGLKSQKALQKHINDKHSTSNASSQTAKSKCNYCDLVFETKKARKAHQKTHRIPCHHCHRVFKSEEGRLQHEAAKHGPKHTSMHNFKCPFCHTVFSNLGLLLAHQRCHVTQCRYCANDFGTQSSTAIHEQSCAYNPATMVNHSITIVPFGRPTLKSSSSSSEHGMMEIGEGSSTAAVIPCTDDADASESSSSDSTSDEGEMFHCTDTDAVGNGTTFEDPCSRVRSQEPIACFGGEQTPSPNVPGDAENSISAEDGQQNVSADYHDVTFRCAACLDSFTTEETYLGHLCGYRTALLKPHCPVCYSQFEDQLLLQRHLEGLEAFSCQLCQARCCSEEIRQDHLLSHPTCPKCGESFADNLALCEHVESHHPVVVCWDCNGIVAQTDSLESHYTESPAHPSCVICGVGTRNSNTMDEHIRYLHSAVIAMPNHLEGCNTNPQVGPDEGPSLTENESPREDQGSVGPPLDLSGAMPPLPVVEPIVPLGRPCDEVHISLSQVESSLFLSPQLPTPAQAEHISAGPAEGACVVNEEQPPDRMDADACHRASPSPCEHGSDVSGVQVHPTDVTTAAIDNDTQPLSPVSTVSADSSFFNTVRTNLEPIHFGVLAILRIYQLLFSSGFFRRFLDSSASYRDHSQMTSSSVVVSLVDKVERQVQTQHEEVSVSVGNTAPPKHRLHCRICLKDPCEELTATLCGHVFCKQCITQAVVAKPECPVCKSATVLYCLFKLDLSA